MPTYNFEGHDHEMPDWLIKAASLDPEHTHRVLDRMRGVWPDDFIELLECHPWTIMVDWPKYTPVDHSSD